MRPEILEDLPAVGVRASLLLLGLIAAGYLVSGIP
jgi:hypothetical protein